MLSSEEGSHRKEKKYRNAETCHRYFITEIDNITKHKYASTKKIYFETKTTFLFIYNLFLDLFKNPKIWLIY